ncbi:hypothetical protein DPMN_094789 [Dreissena polymorpha]|uniref:Uncharacterized protein n=1 Tax=Dreissena polymorpha TaxID=45954 RepID=A0A9D4R248_DREPO|nr:hypothetical protein DPMN_094789 [Dreissena polymorpha]
MPMNQTFPVTYSKSIQMHIRHLHFCAENIKTSLKYENEYPEELGFVLKHIYNALASMKASKRIAMKKPINEDIFKMFESSLSPSHITNYLKYAAMLVCTQQYTRAEAILQQVEGLISSDMIHVCAAQPDKLIQAEEINKTGVSSLSDIFMRHISKMLIDVEFTAGEINCVPSHLWMFRTDTEEDCRVGELSKSMKIRKTHVIVDAKPFLHYLKYMSSKVGRARLKPIFMLSAYITEKPDVVSSRGHIRTTLNMYGHILELENIIPQAWYIHKMSVKLVPWNNPAYWHLFRLLGNFVYGK